MLVSVFTNGSKVSVNLRKDIKEEVRVMAEKDNYVIMQHNKKIILENCTPIGAGMKLVYTLHIIPIIKGKVHQHIFT